MRGVALAMLVGLATSAHAAGDDKRTRDVSSIWLVRPVAAATGPIVVRKGDYVVRGTLLPVGYATLDGDAIDGEGGKPLAPAGTPLMKLSANTGTVECVVGEPPKTGLGNFWAGFKGGDTRLCLRDLDGDGRFEAFVRYKGLVQGLPSVNGRLPKALHPLRTPVGYTARDPATMTPAYFLAIRYDGKAALSGAPVFVDAFGQEGDVGTLNRAWPRGEDGKGKLGHTGRVLLDGATLNVAADNGDTLTLTVETPLPAGLFAVSQVGSNGFY